MSYLEWMKKFITYAKNKQQLFWSSSSYLTWTSAPQTQIHSTVWLSQYSPITLSHRQVYTFSRSEHSNTSDAVLRLCIAWPTLIHFDKQIHIMTLYPNLMADRSYTVPFNNYCLLMKRLRANVKYFQSINSEPIYELGKVNNFAKALPMF